VIFPLTCNDRIFKVFFQFKKGRSEATSTNIQSAIFNFQFRPVRVRHFPMSSPTPFYKYHALGNDYIVLNPAEAGDSLTVETIRLICHRNFGIRTI